MVKVFTSLQYIKLPSTFCTKHITVHAIWCMRSWDRCRLPLPTGTFPGSLKMHSSCSGSCPWRRQGRGSVLVPSLLCPSSLLSPQEGRRLQPAGFWQSLEGSANCKTRGSWEYHVSVWFCHQFLWISKSVPQRAKSALRGWGLEVGTLLIFE